MKNKLLLSALASFLGGLAVWYVTGQIQARRIADRVSDARMQ